MRTHLTHAAPALAPFLRFKNERVKTSVNDEGKRGIPVSGVSEIVSIWFIYIESGCVITTNNPQRLKQPNDELL